MRTPETAAPLSPETGHPQDRLGLDHPAIRKEVDRILSLRRTSLRTNVDTAVQIGASLSRMRSKLKYGLWSGLLRNQFTTDAPSPSATCASIGFQGNPNSGGATRAP